MAISYIPEQKPYKNLTPFKRFAIQNFPWINEDFDALTNIELMGKIIEKINDLIANGETLQENVESLYNAFVELQSYVDNYFDNLDVQNEINKKLDEMARSGELKNIVYNIFEDLTNDINDLNNKIDSVSSGSPAGVFETLSDLETEDPDHSKIYVVTSSGHWYYYNETNEEWTDGGLYQAPVNNETIETLLDNISDIEETNVITPIKGYYIIINNEAQNPKGSQVDALYDSFACSDFIEIPAGTYNVITNMNNAYGQTSRAGWATYDENQNCLNTGNGITPYNIEGAKYIRFSNYDSTEEHQGLFVTFTIKKIGNTIHMINNYVTPQMYGAIGDGIADDTRAFQSALDSGYDVYVPTNKGEVYKITNTLIMNEIFQFHKIFGDCTPNLNYANEGIHFINIPSTRNKPLFDIRCSGVHFYGLSFNSFSFSDYWNKIFITTENFAQADKDIIIENCYINGFRTGVIFNGRGLQIKRCELGGIQTLATLSWTTTGNTGQMGDNYGMRAIEICDNRIHNVHMLVNLISGNAQGMRICNNYSDNGMCTLISSTSDCDNISIVDNYFLNVYYETTDAFISFPSNDINNTIISNNHFVYDSEFNKTELTKLIESLELNNSQIINNIIYCASDYIVDCETITNSIISLNYFGNVTTPIAYTTKTNSIVENNLNI